MGKVVPANIEELVIDSWNRKRFNSLMYKIEKIFLVIFKILFLFFLNCFYICINKKYRFPSPNPINKEPISNLNVFVLLWN